MLIYINALNYAMNKNKLLGSLGLIAIVKDYRFTALNQLCCDTKVVVKNCHNIIQFSQLMCMLNPNCLISKYY